MEEELGMFHFEENLTEQYIYYILIGTEDAVHVYRWDQSLPVYKDNCPLFMSFKRDWDLTQFDMMGQIVVAITNRLIYERG